MLRHVTQGPRSMRGHRSALQSVSPRIQRFYAVCSALIVVLCLTGRPCGLSEQGNAETLAPRVLTAVSAHVFDLAWVSPAVSGGDYNCYSLLDPAAAILPPFHRRQLHRRHPSDSALHALRCWSAGRCSPPKTSPAAFFRSVISHHPIPVVVPLYSRTPQNRYI